MRHVTISVLAIIALNLFSACHNGDNGQKIPKGVTVAAKIDQSDIHASDIPSVFKANKVEYQQVSVLNWAEQYPYLPSVDFAVAHNSSNMLIHYRVTEKRTIGTMVNDMDGVYKESCCELFCMESGDSLYYNIESNCLGSILMQCGTCRSDRDYSTLDNLKQIDRWASLGRDSIGTVAAETHWELALVVPLSAFWSHSYMALDGKTFLVNVYNCVGSGDDRQYVTWHPVSTETPDFHRPEFFQPVYFAE